MAGQISVEMPGQFSVEINIYLIDPPAERLEFMRRRLKGKFGTLPLIVAGWFATGNDDDSARPYAGVHDILVARVQQHDAQNTVEPMNSASKESA